MVPVQPEPAEHPALIAARGVEVGHETVREWCDKFGAAYAKQVRRRRPQPGDKWHLDELVVDERRPSLPVAGRGPERHAGRKQQPPLPGPDYSHVSTSWPGPCSGEEPNNDLADLLAVALSAFRGLPDLDHLETCRRGAREIQHQTVDGPA